MGINPFAGAYSDWLESVLIVNYFDSVHKGRVYLVVGIILLHKTLFQMLRINITFILYVRQDNIVSILNR